VIELPEAISIARQIQDKLVGKVIEEGVRGNSPHKFAFYTGEPDEYAVNLSGKTLVRSWARGSLILVSLAPGYVLAMGGGGERILYHETEATLPKKHHLLLKFTDGTFLSVTVLGWGSALLLPEADMDAHPFMGGDRISPLDGDFTLERFLALFDELPEGDARAIKFFLISQPGVLGIGNGYLQDILFQSKVHPCRRAADTTPDERRGLYVAIQDTLKHAVELGGRDTERDLFDALGCYSRILHTEAVGKPCPECRTPIEKIQFLGGACYFCPSCQPPPKKEARR
jgi:formamidopyrimidine-DNA glycosylase